MIFATISGNTNGVSVFKFVVHAHPSKEERTYSVAILGLMTKEKAKQFCLRIEHCSVSSLSWRILQTASMSVRVTPILIIHKAIPQNHFRSSYTLQTVGAKG